MINHPFHTSRSSGSARTSQARTGLSAGYNGPYGSRLEENLVSYLRGQTLRVSDAPPAPDTMPGTTPDTAPDAASVGAARLPALDPPLSMRTTTPVHRGFSQGRTEALPPADPASRSAEDVDGAITHFMRDPRYADPARREGPYRDKVTRLWDAAYPGPYEPGSFGRNVRPNLTVGDVLGLADGLGLVDPVTDDNAQPAAGRTSSAFVQLPKTEAEKRRLDDWMAKRPSHIPVAVWQAMEPALPGLWDMPGWGRLPLGMRLEMENALATPQGRAGLRRAAQAEIEGMDIDGKERSALLAAVDSALPVETDAKGGEGADDPDNLDGVQVANAGAIRSIIRLIIGSSRKKDEPPLPLPPPLEPPQEPKDAPRNPHQEIPDPLPDRTETPVDPPNLDTTETLEREPAASRSKILITPAGKELTEDEYLEKYPDQSDILPQGTILAEEGKFGTRIEVDVGNVNAVARRNYRRGIQTLPNLESEKCLAALAKNGKLTTASKTTDQRLTTFEVQAKGDPTQAGMERFHDLHDTLARSKQGLKPTEIEAISDGEKTRYEFRIKDSKNGDTTVSFRSASSKHGPTSELQVHLPDGRTLKTRFKTRYKGQSG